MKLVVPDLISPSYFPALAAVELGCIARRGVDVELSLHFPVTSAVDRLRAGEIDLVAGSAHAIFHGAHDGGGVKILAALSKHTYWFLVVRADLGLATTTPLERLRGLRIGAAPGPDGALIQLLTDAGIDPDSVTIAPVPGTSASEASFGVAAARALAGKQIDGFWANGMGAEVAVREGFGTVIVDARRGIGPKGSDRYTFACLMSTDQLWIERSAELRAVVAGLVEAQGQLRHDPKLAGKVAERLFPPMEAGLAEELIARDAPYYDAEICPDDITDMVRFASALGMTSRDLTLSDLVFPDLHAEWHARTEDGGAA